MPKVTISILAYGALAHSKECVNSVIANSEGYDYEIILTDNGSTDGTGEYFRELAWSNPNIRVISNEENLGFIEPNRRALELARGDYFVLLNNDAKVPKGWLDKLLEPFSRNPKVALTGPEGSCSELTHDFAGIASRKLDYLEGSCLCGRTDILRRHGLFSDYLTFAYHEDSDLSLRMQELGYAIQRVPFRIQHVRAVTSKTVPEVFKHQEANRVKMIERWGAWRQSRKFNYPVIIRRAASTGDVLLATAVVKAVSERCPRALILVETNCRGIFSGNPRVTRISHKFPQMKNARVIDLNMSYENSPGKHIINAYADQALLGPIELKSEFYQSARCIEHARGMLGLGTGPWIAIHAGPTTWDGKNWSDAKWKELIPRLDEAGWKILLVGNPGYDLPHHLDMRGKTRIHELAGFLKHCTLFCGVDSFPMHLAQAVGCPVVPLFGVTSPEFILTFGSKAFPVISDPDHEFSGIRHKVTGLTHVTAAKNPMDTIEVEQVFEAILESQGVPA